MSNFKKMVRVTFENAAEEQQLYSSGESFPIPCWTSPIGRIESELLEALVFYRAKKIGCAKLHLHTALICRFQIDELSELPTYQFEEAMHYLLTYVGSH